MDLVIRSNRIVTEDGYLNGVIAVNDGKIVGLHDASTEVEADTVIDAPGSVVLPGVIDTHTHIRYPGHPEREDFVTGTQAAAAGGITTLFEMPISTPGVRTAEIVRDRMKYAEESCLVDIGFYAGGGHQARAQYQPMADAGVVAYKIFLHRPQAGREHEFEGLYTIDDGYLYEDLKQLRKTGRLVCFHAENDDILEVARKELEETLRIDYGAHAESHPVIAEVEAVSRVILFAEDTGAMVGIKHVTSPHSAKLIKEAKQRGVPIVAETCPHYLFFSNDELLKYGPYAKINPPLRSAAERDGLWEYVLDGTIDYIGTDHAPFTVEEKERGKDNIFLAPSGIPGFEAELPLLLTAAADGKLDFLQLSKLTATNQSRIFRVDDRKGSIAVGKDADLAIVNPDVKWTLDHNTMVTKAKEIAKIYDGIEVQGQVETTLVRGTVVYDRGVFKANPGHGKVVTPR
ncbi:allantoinase AllB [Alicyclobacillus mengziensis]|uniref:allantoinase n=1 Tax=Alicyclobacillus mengziensis TaxID=2931921 RepID=A0A9X7W139_9BACL|nr:allantoinase AllB [Alicyclobacillus mengziensis]QSO47408.1 allantoinase AllB [Alicyclobacillus mengziensis]